MMRSNAPHALPVAAVMDASSAMLQKQLYAIFTTPVNGIGPILENIEDHLEIERQGLMHAAGPMWADDGQSWEGDGLVVVRAGSREEAIAIAERDEAPARCSLVSRTVPDDL